MNRTKRTVTTRKNGFTILQMIVTIAIIAVVTTFGVLGITTARAEFRLNNSARLFASYVEKARADSVRRHASTGSESSVETFAPGTSTYAVTMDFGSGTVETRSFPLETGLSFNTIAKKVSFDWRGRIPAAWVFQVFSTQLAKSLPVDVSGSGDITVGEQRFPDGLIPALAIAEVTGDTISDPIPPPSGSPTPTPDPSATPTPIPSPTATPANNGNGGDNGNGGSGNGNGNGNNPTPTPTPIPTPTAIPTPTPSVTPTPIPQCVATLSPSTLSLSQSVDEQKTGTALLTFTNATGVRTLSVAQEGNGNSLVTSLSLVRLDGSGYSIISVTTKNGAGNRGVFLVDVIADPACGSMPKLTVSVSN